MGNAVTGDGLLTRFWGKSRGGVHPALCHMIDVGMVARALVERSPAAAARLGWDAGTIGFVVALHDLGKLSPGFQAKSEPLAQAVRALGYEFAACAETDHAKVTYQHLRRRGPATAPQNLIARALGAHHGSYPPVDLLGPAKLGGGPWQAARDQAVVALAGLFGVAPGCLSTLALEPPGAVVLAGLTAVSDWIGSDQTHFPPAGDEPPDLPAYAAAAAERAGRALDAVGWPAWCLEPRQWSFGGAFGFEPNPLQLAAIAAAEQATGPLLAILEAPMGLGKTEAALWLADRLLEQAGHVGLYVALPTQATSRQMFHRVCQDYLKRRFTNTSVDVALLHGQAAFDEAYEAMASVRDRLALGEIHDADEADGAVAAASWFRGGKQGLLTPFAVGTIDQALLGALQTRHQFVRLYGLANKVVILDEVHAYDTYTTGLIERLVAWLAALGSSLVLLSATLPQAKRQALLTAWGAGAPAAWGAYPRLTVAGGPGATAVIALAEPEQRALRIVPLPTSGEWHQAPRDLLAAKLAGGGCAAWLCNTVDRAQAAYLSLRADGRFDDAEVTLFHARFPICRRAEIEGQVVERFGKAGCRPTKAVVVATQVIEQSLDLDFDLMVTDPAPIDLLLQRSGRVHRHERPFRPLPAAEVYWLAEPAGANPFDHFREAAGVYDAWLMYRTWCALGEGMEVTSAGELAGLVEGVYGDAEPVVPAAWQEAAERARREWRNLLIEQGNLARRNAVEWPDEDDPFRRQVLVPSDDTADPRLPAEALRAVTRLGDPSLQVVCVEERDSALDPGDGEPPIAPDREPTDDEARRLYRASVRIGHRGWFAALRDGEEPTWRRSPLLRHCRLARLHGGRCEFDGLTMRLDEELGLVFFRRQ